MNKLNLEPTRRYFGIGDKNDYTVLDRGRCIGHIVLSRQAPEGRPWFWKIFPRRFTQSLASTNLKAVSGHGETSTGLTVSHDRRAAFPVGPAFLEPSRAHRSLPSRISSCRGVGIRHVRASII